MPLEKPARSRKRRARQSAAKPVKQWIPWAVQVRGEHGHVAWRFPAYEGEPAPTAARLDPQLDAEHEASEAEQARREEIRNRSYRERRLGWDPWDIKPEERD